MYLIKPILNVIIWWACLIWLIYNQYIQFAVVGVMCCVVIQSVGSVIESKFDVLQSSSERRKCEIICKLGEYCNWRKK